MFICNSHNFVFLRIPKNASSSIAHYLVSELGNSNRDSWTEVNDRGGPNMNNVPENIKDKYREQFHYIHLLLQELIEENFINKQNATSMEKIGIIRNPLERQLSLFFFLNRNRRGNASVESFRHQFRNGCHENDKNNKYRQIEYLQIDGELRENTTWWKFEDLEARAIEFVRSKNPQAGIQIPRHKTNIRPKRDLNELIEHYYDDKTRTAVLDYYASDLKVYNNL